MAFLISNGWDVAHLLIHEAFSHLGNACRLNIEAFEYYKKIDDSVHPSEFLSISSQLNGINNLEGKECIKAIILLQAGMEAWISWAYTKSQLNIPKPNNFKQKWNKAFEHLNINNNFESYALFYSNYRNPIIHPSTLNDINVIANINSKEIYEGFQAAWKSMESLSIGLNFPFDQDSWSTMCNANKVILPDKINDLGDLKTASMNLLNRMEIFYNNN